MSIIYCDYLTGDDATGSGTNTHPYKTITKSDDGLGAGDEIRVAKSTAAATMSGTLAWVAGSTSITTSADLTSVLSPGDFVGKDTAGETWWEVITVVSDTLTLYKKYSGTTETISSKKLGVTSTGESVSSTTKVQEVNSSGESGNRLKISGGWDLSTETQDGHTYFRQMHGTFNNRYGYGIYINYYYIEVEKVSFLRYRYGIYMGSSTSKSLITNLICHSNGLYGIDSHNDYNTIIDVICNANSTGIYLYNSKYNVVTSPSCDSNSGWGINLNTSEKGTITDPICNYNGNGLKIYGQYFYSGPPTLTNPICNNNTYDGIEINGNPNMTITTPTCNNNGDSGLLITNSSHNTELITPICNDNDEGIYVSTSDNVIITEPTCNSNDDGIYMIGSVNNTITKSTCNNNTRGIHVYTSFNVVATVFSGTGNTSDIYVPNTNYYYDCPIIKCQHLNGAGINKSFYRFGITYRDTAEARSGECLKFDPTSDTYYIRQNFNFRAANGVAKTLTAYIKDDASFNGDIQAAIYFMGVKITGWTEWAPTTSYVQKSIVAASGDITEDGVLELAIKVRGTAGNVYVDDLGVS